MKKLTLEEAFLAIQFESMIPWSPYYSPYGKEYYDLHDVVTELFGVDNKGDFKYYTDKEVINELLNYYNNTGSMQKFITKCHLQKFKKNGFYSIVGSLKDTGFYPISKEYFNNNKDKYGEGYYKLLEDFNEKVFPKSYKRKLTLEEAFVALVFETTLPWSKLYKGEASVKVVLDLFGVDNDSNVNYKYYIDRKSYLIFEDMVCETYKFIVNDTVNDLIDKLRRYAQDDIETIIKSSRGVYPVSKEYFEDNKDIFGKDYYKLLEEFNENILKNLLLNKE